MRPIFAILSLLFPVHPGFPERMSAGSGTEMNVDNLKEDAGREALYYYVEKTSVA